MDNITSTSITTLAHELVARDEQYVGVFFASVAIQYYLHKDMLNGKVNPPYFVKFFVDIETYASQRVFIKNIINDPKYRKIIETLRGLFLTCDKSKDKHSYDVFLTSINKSFLIRQIFNHTDQVLEKYKFIDKFITKDVTTINMDDLYNKLNTLPVEQQILVLTRIFSSLKDEISGKKKTILDSFGENIGRMQAEIRRNPARFTAIEVNNLISFGKFVIEHKTENS